MIEQYIDQKNVVAFGTSREALKNLGKWPGWVYVGGVAMNPEDVDRCFLKFEAGNLNLALPYYWASLGITLKTAETLLILDRHQDEAVNQQALARVGPECEIVYM